MISKYVRMGALVFTAIGLLCTPGAFAQSTQTAQSIMVDLTYDNTTYQIEGSITWTYQRDTCAVDYYTNAVVGGSSAYTFVSCSGGTVNCSAYTGANNQACCPQNAPSDAAIQAAMPAPGGGNDTTSNQAQDDRCVFFCGGSLTTHNYTKDAPPISGANTRGNWKYSWNYAITPDSPGTVDPSTCWDSEETGGTVDVGFTGFVCSESFQKQTSRSKYSFTLTDSAGSRVSNIQVTLEQLDGSTWNTVQGPVLVPEADLITGQLPVTAATEDFLYSANGGVFGNSAVFSSLHYSGGKPANSVSNILNGINDGTNSDNFAGNNNDLAAGNVHVAHYTGEWAGLTEAGTYRTLVTGTLKGNAGGASPSFSVTSNIVEIGGCTCGQ